MNKQLLERIKRMSDESIYHELYRDHLTGLLNRKAFDFDEKPYYAIIDLDSLKYVNDTLGHRWGDAQLCALAATLVSGFGHDDVYRLSGDEYAVKGASPTLLNVVLRELSAKLSTFSYGIGSTLEAADAQLNRAKAQRERAGLRAPRGECPPWVESLEELSACS